MKKRWMRSGDSYHPSYINDDVPQEVLEVSDKFDELMAYAHERKVKIIQGGGIISGGLVHFKSIKETKGIS